MRLIVYVDTPLSNQLLACCTKRILGCLEGNAELVLLGLKFRRQVPPLRDDRQGRLFVQSVGSQVRRLPAWHQTPFFGVSKCLVG